MMKPGPKPIPEPKSATVTMRSSLHKAIQAARRRLRVQPHRRPVRPLSAREFTRVALARLVADVRRGRRILFDAELADTPELLGDARPVEPE